MMAFRSVYRKHRLLTRPPAQFVSIQASIYPSYDGPRLCVEYKCDDGISVEDSLAIHNLGIRPDGDGDALRELSGDLDVHFRDVSRMDSQSIDYARACGNTVLPEPRVLGDAPLSSDTSLDQVIRASIFALQVRTGLNIDATARYEAASIKRQEMERERLAAQRPLDLTKLIRGPGP